MNEELSGLSVGHAAFWLTAQAWKEGKGVLGRNDFDVLVCAHLAPGGWRLFHAEDPFNVRIGELAGECALLAEELPAQPHIILAWRLIAARAAHKDDEADAFAARFQPLIIAKDKQVRKFACDFISLRPNYFNLSDIGDQVIYGAAEADFDAQITGPMLAFISGGYDAVDHRIKESTPRAADQLLANFDALREIARDLLNPSHRDLCAAVENRAWFAVRHLIVQ